jgi:hypothetical protein
MASAAVLAALAAVPSLVVALGWRALRDEEQPVRLAEVPPKKHPEASAVEYTAAAPAPPPHSSAPGPFMGGVTGPVALADALYDHNPARQPDRPALFDGQVTDALGRTFNTFSDAPPQSNGHFPEYHHSRSAGSTGNRGAAMLGSAMAPADNSVLQELGAGFDPRAPRREVTSVDMGRNRSIPDQRQMMMPGNQYDTRGRMDDIANQETWRNHNDIAPTRTNDTTPFAVGEGFSGFVPSEGMRRIEMSTVRSYNNRPTQRAEHHGGRTTAGYTDTAGAEAPRAGRTRTVQGLVAPGRDEVPDRPTGAWIQAGPARPSRDDLHTVSRRAAAAGPSGGDLSRRIHADVSGVSNDRRTYPAVFNTVDSSRRGPQVRPAPVAVPTNRGARKSSAVRHATASEGTGPALREVHGAPRPRQTVVPPVRLEQQPGADYRSGAGRPKQARRRDARAEKVRVHQHHQKVGPRPNAPRPRRTHGHDGRRIAERTVREAVGPEKLPRRGGGTRRTKRTEPPRGVWQRGGADLRDDAELRGAPRPRQAHRVDSRAQSRGDAVDAAAGEASGPRAGQGHEYQGLEVPGHVAASAMGAGPVHADLDHVHRDADRVDGHVPAGVRDTGQRVDAAAARHRHGRHEVGSAMDRGAAVQGPRARLDTNLFDMRPDDLLTLPMAPELPSAGPAEIQAIVESRADP